MFTPKKGKECKKAISHQVINSDNPMTNNPVNTTRQHPINEVSSPASPSK